MKLLPVAFLLLCGTGSAFADLASTNYVKDSLATRVSTEQSAQQTLQGKYVVTGTFEVETPKLPTEI